MLTMRDVVQAIYKVDADAVRYRKFQGVPCTVWQEGDISTGLHANGRGKFAVGRVLVVHYAEPERKLSPIAWELFKAFADMGANCTWSPEYNPDLELVVHRFIVEEVRIDGSI